VPSFSEGVVVCVDFRHQSPDRLDDLYKHLPQLLRMNRFWPVVLLCSTEAEGRIRITNSRPIEHGFRAVIPENGNWRALLRLTFTSPELITDTVATWMLRPVRHQADDRSLLVKLLALPPRTSLADAIYKGGPSADTVSRRLHKLRLPSASEIRMLGLAIRAAMALQRNASFSEEAIAHALGYDAGSNVSRLLSRRFGVRAAEVRERLGWEWLMGRWQERLDSTGRT
jgi:hypothetical protein